MSLAIDVDEITDVLLVDGWHAVEWHYDKDGAGASTFDTDAYEIMWYGSAERKKNMEPIGHFQPGDKPQDYTGFSFREDGVRVFGPMSSVLAVKVGKK